MEHPGHCKHQIHTGKLQGVNNKIQVIKFMASGYHDLEYLALKVKQALPGRFESNQNEENPISTCKVLAAVARLSIDGYRTVVLKR